MTRYSVPLREEGYARANQAFRQQWSGDRAQVRDYLLARLPPAPADRRLAVLGVGVGDGEFDVPLIHELLARSDGALRYVAVEPNAAQLHGFAQRAAAADLRDDAVELHAQRAEDFVADAPFDCIHYIHALYHMPGAEERLVAEARARLTPGGCLIIALAAEQGGIYQMIQRLWGVIDYSFFTHGLFGQESLTALLDRLGLPYERTVFPEVAIDVTPCFDPGSELGRHLLNFVLQADMQRVPAEVYLQALEALRDLSRVEGGRFLLSHPSGVFALRSH